MPIGVLGQQGQKVAIVENFDVFKAKASITYWPWSGNTHQVVGQKGH